MKRWLFGLGFFFFSLAGFSQKVSFASVDDKAASLDAPTPDSLARLINANFFTTPEKVRAIYSWITGHIAYNAAIFKPWMKFTPSPDPLDTAAVWPSGDEMVARKVMRRRTAVCDGYARLFKVLCDYSGIEAVLVSGYGRVAGRGDRFRTNHTWNAVKIDRAWHLLDVTWASGFLTPADEYIVSKNDFYYLTPPDQFIYDHYPEDLRWTLLPNPTAPAEFRRTPFRSKNFFRYGFSESLPATGIVEAAVGDTLRFVLRIKDVERIRRTSADPFTDTANYAAWPKSSFIRPTGEKDATVVYTYAVQPGTEWIHLLYNDDVVLQYRLKPVEVLSRKE